MSLLIMVDQIDLEEDILLDDQLAAMDLGEEDPGTSAPLPPLPRSRLPAPPAVRTAPSPAPQPTPVPEAAAPPAAASTTTTSSSAAAVAPTTAAAKTPTGQLPMPATMAATEPPLPWQPTATHSTAPLPTTALPTTTAHSSSHSSVWPPHSK